MWGRERMATEDRPAPWGDDRDRTRVLVEHGDPGVRDLVARDLQARGYDVRTCAGPERDVACPLLCQQSCPAIDGTDVVVSGLIGRPRGRAITRRIRRQHPDTPVVVEATAWQVEQTDLDVHRVFPLFRESLADAIAIATARP